MQSEGSLGLRRILSPSVEAVGKHLDPIGCCLPALGVQRRRWDLDLVTFGLGCDELRGISGLKPPDPRLNHALPSSETVC